MTEEIDWARRLAMLQAYDCEGTTYKAVGEAHGVSGERARQVVQSLARNAVYGLEDEIMPPEIYSAVRATKLWQMWYGDRIEASEWKDKIKRIAVYLPQMELRAALSRVCFDVIHGRVVATGGTEYEPLILMEAALPEDAHVLVKLDDARADWSAILTAVTVLGSVVGVQSDSWFAGKVVLLRRHESNRHRAFKYARSEEG